MSISRFFEQAGDNLMVQKRLSDTKQDRRGLQAASVEVRESLNSSSSSTPARGKYHNYSVEEKVDISKYACMH